MRSVVQCKRERECVCMKVVGVRVNVREGLRKRLLSGSKAIWPDAARSDVRRAVSIEISRR